MAFVSGETREAAAIAGLQPQAGDLTLGAVGRALWRRKLVILLPALIAAAAAYFWVQTLTPMFRSEARVLIERSDNVFTRPEAERTAGGDRTALDQEAVASQVQVISSRDIALKVIRDLKLGERPEFDPLLRGVSLTTRILTVLRLSSGPSGESPEERVLAAYFERLVVYQVDRARVIAIDFQSADRELAARVANAIADAYLAQQAEAKQSATRDAGQWLSGEIDEMRRKVADAEARVEAFRSQANLFVGANNGTLVAQQLSETNTQLVLARTQRNQAEARLRALREILRTGGAVEVSDALNSDLMRRLIESRSQLRAQRAEQGTSLLDQHPRMRELASQIAEIDQQIRAEAARLVRAVENEVRIAASRVEELNRTLDQLKRQSTLAAEQDVQLRALEREAKAERDLLEAYLGRWREASARDSAAAAPPDARIISRAVAASAPFFPKGGPIVAIAFLGVLCLGIGTVATFALLAGGAGVPAVSDLRQVDEEAAPPLAPEPPPVPSVPVFASLPDMPEAGHLGTRPAASRAFGPGTRHARALEPLVQAMLAAGPAMKRVMVASTLPGLGATTVTVALSRALAAEGRKVVVVDLAARPALGDLAGDGPAVGLTDLVFGRAAFGEAIHRDPVSRVHVVPLGTAAGADAAAVMAADRTVMALQALAQSYDHLIIDAGDVGSLARPERAARLASHVVLIAEGPETDPALVELHAALIATGFMDVAVLLRGTSAAGTLAEAA